MHDRQVFVECQAAGCGSVLQVVVPATHRQGNGEVLVRCGKCARLLRVQLPHDMLAPDPDTVSRVEPASATPRHHPFPDAPPVMPVMMRRKRTTAYHAYIRDEMKRLKASDPTLDNQAVFKIAASSWALSGAKAAAAAAEQLQQLGQADQAHMTLLDFSAGQGQGATAFEPFNTLGLLPHVSQLQTMAPLTPAQGHVASHTAELPLLAFDRPQASPAGHFTPDETAAAAAFQLNRRDCVGNAMQHTATPAAEDMGPPPTRATSSCSDAANKDQQAAMPAATTAATPAAATGTPQAPHPHDPTLLQDTHQATLAAPAHNTAAESGEVSTDVVPSVSSTTCQQGQSAGRPLTLQQTWEALWGGQSTAAGATAGATAAASGACNATAHHDEPAAQQCPPQQQQQGLVAPTPAQAPSAPHHAAGSGTSAAPGPQQAQQSQLVGAPLPLPQPAAAAKQPGKVSSDAKEAASSDKVLSDSLASWSSGQSPNSATANNADTALASPGTLSGAGGCNTPGILRHSSAPITTAMPGPNQRPAGAAGHLRSSFTTEGPSKQG